MPTKAAATAIERRDTLNCLTFISVRFLLIAAGAQIGRAWGSFGFWGCPDGLSSNCDQFAAPQQTKL
jgi:hypothetical protein